MYMFLVKLVLVIQGEREREERREGRWRDGGREEGKEGEDRTNELTGMRYSS